MPRAVHAEKIQIPLKRPVVIQLSYLCVLHIHFTKLNKLAVNNNSGNPTESDIRIILAHCWFTW